MGSNMDNVILVPTQEFPDSQITLQESGEPPAFVESIPHFMDTGVTEQEEIAENRRVKKFESDYALPREIGDKDDDSDDENLDEKVIAEHNNLFKRFISQVSVQKN